MTSPMRGENLGYIQAGADSSVLFGNARWKLDQIQCWNVDMRDAFGVLLLVAASAIVLSALLIVVLRPFFVRYAVARPSARSSHSKPTPQGAGIAVILSTLIVLTATAISFSDRPGDLRQLIGVAASVIGLMIVGAIDDIRPLGSLPRLFLQATAVSAVIALLPADLRIMTAVPLWLERGFMLVGGVWFVNLVNFMDGIDWMTVVEVVPVTAGLTLFGLMGALPWDATLAALALCGAIIGFAPFNRPVAQLFLGDVGSLPIGLLLGWLLALLAGQGHLAAAALLPLYYLADATITLIRRFATGEPITEAHRSHFYQRAWDGGLSTYHIVSRVFVTNVTLTVLASLTVVNESPSIDLVAFAAGCVLVGTLLWTFEHASQGRNKFTGA
jgi:UDP-N-acetylmuramyl pentapeptide phosphotransferase/UDP-N-acetylglucosamine-1-phosphate transferase